jgi:hypothetical protein
MVNQNASVASSAPVGTPTVDETTPEQSDGSIPEARKEHGLASTNSGAVARTPASGVTPEPFSERTLDRLEDLITEEVKSHGDGLKDSRIGAHILVNWAKRKSWILDRTDSFAISAEAWTPQSLTIDLQVPRLATISGEDYFLPLEAFPLNDVREVIAYDENGQRLPTLAPVEQKYAIGSMLIALASTIVNGSTLLSEDSETSQALRSAASSGDLGPIKEIPDEKHREALLGNSEFKELANFFLKREFLCLRTTWSSGTSPRHVVRVTYQQAVSPKPYLSGGWLRQAAAQLGIRVTTLEIPLPTARGAGHWRLVITAPVGAELHACQLIADGNSNSKPVKATVGRQTTVEFSPEDGNKFLKIEFRISRQWRTWVLTNALLITLLLAVGAWRIGFVAQNKGDLGTKDLTAAFLLGINGAFAGILARPTDDALTSTFLSGIRFAISVLGILAFTAVATLAFGPSGGALFLVWLGLASAAGLVFLLVFLGSGLWERW